MTINQMVQALTSVGACFAVTTAKTILPDDPFESKSSYHIHPDASNRCQEDIVRLYSQKQLIDWVRTAKAAARCTDEEKAFEIWQAYVDRWL